MQENCICCLLGLPRAAWHLTTQDFFIAELIQIFKPAPDYLEHLLNYFYFQPNVKSNNYYRNRVYKSSSRCLECSSRKIDTIW